MTKEEIRADLAEPELPQLPPRKEDSHKGTFGSGLLIGGSRGMAGSIAMSGLAAVKSGAGLVRVAVPDRCLETVAGLSPCLMTIPLYDDEHGRLVARASDIKAWLEKSTCVAVGPGMGQSTDTKHLVRDLLKQASCPLVIDADGLNNLAHWEDWPTLTRAPVILTPHPGEWSRLSGVSAKDRQQQIAAAIDFAGKHDHLVIVLKGHRTLITDGRTAVFNTSGTPAMATGGSGDVLTGIITALVCQGLAPRDAAHLAVHVHGLSAEIAERELRSHVVLPTELIDFLPRGFESAAKLSSDAQKTSDAQKR